jgi:hypothetical protein
MFDHECEICGADATHSHKGFARCDECAENAAASVYGSAVALTEEESEPAVWTVEVPSGLLGLYEEHAENEP